MNCFDLHHALKPKRSKTNAKYFTIPTGKNLQICFVNDAAAAADGDSLSSDSESCPKLSKPVTHTNQPPVPVRHSNITAQANPYNSRPLSMKKTTSQEKGTKI